MTDHVREKIRFERSWM